ncbi:MAG: MlaD family protein [Nannocystaceae bacterium]|nr:MlaD family protein [Nannocystaceae bacterium]
MNRTHIGLGIFVVATVGLLIWLAQSLGAIGGGGGKRYELRLAHAAGLVENNAVKIAGVSVGKIEKVAVDHDIAVLTLRVDGDIVLHDDAKAIVRAKSLLGEKYLQLHPGERDGAVLADGGTIPNVEVPFEIDEVLNALEPILGGDDSIAAALAPLAGQLNDLLADASGKRGKPPIITREQIDKLVEDLTATSASVRRMTEQNEQGVAELVKDGNALVDNANALLTGPKVTRIVSNVESITTDLDARLPGLLDRADKALAELEKLAGVVDEDKRKKIATIIDDASVATANLRELTDELRGVSKFVGPLVKNLATITERASKVDETMIRQFFQREGMKIYFGSKKKAEESLEDFPDK